MRYIKYILLLASLAFPAEYGVMSVCTRLDGHEYCYTAESRYVAIEIGGTLLVANGFNHQKFFQSGKDTTFYNRDSIRVWFAPMKDEDSTLVLVHEFRDDEAHGKTKNLWISDTTGCVTIKYAGATRENYDRFYRSFRVDTMEHELMLIGKCQDKRYGKQPEKTTEP